MSPPYVIHDLTEHEVMPASRALHHHYVRVIATAFVLGNPAATETLKADRLAPRCTQVERALPSVFSLAHGTRSPRM